MSALQFKRAAPSMQRGHKKTPPFSEVSVYRMAERTGLEPATSGVTGQHSNQLNYRSATKLGSLNAFRRFGNTRNDCRQRPAVATNCVRMVAAEGTPRTN